jgi:very-short-patch-repair endonuclease
MSLKNPYMSGGMFEGASHIIFANAKHLRKNMTDAEKALWIHVRKGLLGFKIRRQHPIGLYIADFYCHHVRLIIEIDGSIHNNTENKQLDTKRESDLISWGYQIIRFSNEYILSKPEEAVRKIENKISELNTIQKQNTLQTAESKSPL